MQDQKPSKKQPYRRPAIVSSAAFERLALACNGNNGRTGGFYREDAKTNTATCTVLMTS